MRSTGDRRACGSGCTPASRPFGLPFPIGVRTASVITASDLGHASSIDGVTLKLLAGWVVRKQTRTLLGSCDGEQFPTIETSAGYTFDPAAKNTVDVHSRRP